MYEYRATVFNVVDGDTVDVEIDLGLHIYHKTRLRLYGINTPELHSKVKKEVAAAKVAKARLEELILNKTITIKTHKDKTEKYGRYLAEIADENNRNVNAIMVTEGLAKPYFGEKR